MPLEELTSKKPNLLDFESGAPRFGCTMQCVDQSKLDNRATEGWWVGYDSESKASQIYSPEKQTVSVEHNVKFNDGYAPLPESVLVEGEWIEVDQPTLSPTMVTSSSGGGRTSTATTPSVLTPSVNPPVTDSVILPVTDPLEGLDDVPEERKSSRTKNPSAYIQRIHAGEGTATGLINQPALPRGVENTTLAVDGEFAMSSATEEALGSEPRNEQEARSRVDWPLWEEAMKTELIALEETGTWVLVERPSMNIVRSRWVY